jgi:OmpA-OmpF porin, OOP family
MSRSQPARSFGPEQALLINLYMFSNKTPWIVLLLLWMGGSTWWHVCKIKQLCANTPAEAVTTATATVAMPPLAVIDGDKLNLNVPGNFSFAKSGAVANDAAIGNTVQTIADYLKANPGRTLALTGYYHADEQNTTSFANLGLARAEGVREKLVALGVPAAQLTTRGAEIGVPAEMPYNIKGDSLYGGLAFAFDGAAVAAPAETPTEKPKTEEALAEEQKFESVFKPIDLYFKSAESTFIETDDTKAFFKEARKYLSKHKSKQLLLTGHTDSEGEDFENMDLAKKRASAVKKRLVAGGIVGSQIKIVAKGESEPKASNDTEEGRKANRRVTVVVQ